MDPAPSRLCGRRGCRGGVLCEHLNVSCQPAAAMIQRTAMPKPKTSERRQYQDGKDNVIHLVAPTNPKQPGSKTASRFAYVAACKAKDAPRAEDAFLDITCDCARGFIEVIEK